jgi:hypothetical protein
MQMVARNNYAADEYAQEFGLTISKDMADVPGRILNPPTVCLNMFLYPAWCTLNLRSSHKLSPYLNPVKVHPCPPMVWVKISFNVARAPMPRRVRFT